MADITASMVKELRQMTDAAMMECKKALVEAEGDMDKAVDILRTVVWLLLLRRLAALRMKALFGPLLPPMLSPLLSSR